MSKARPNRSGPVVLIVLDGWGYRLEEAGNAIALGATPTWDSIVRKAPFTLLEASGPAVGLPEGQMGNSEVGHLNLGTGRVPQQDIVRISSVIRTGDFYQLPVLTELCRHIRGRDGTLHLIGLIGTGGVHALDEHLVAAMELASRHGVRRVAIHAFLDGRDTPPTSAADFMRAVADAASAHTGGDTTCFVATATGRYFAMDRDRRWDRTKLAYDAMVHAAGHLVDDPVVGIAQAYERGETDEFIKPLVVRHDGTPFAPIRDGDGIFCFNFRADRMRQIVRALVIEGFDGFETGERPGLSLVTMTEYDATFPTPAAFQPDTLSQIVGQVISASGRTQLRTAETEKYAHVTYFFNAGVEVPHRGEERILVDSQRVTTYDLMPEMSAHGIADVLCRAIEDRQHDFILCNYANGDMVGHSGILSATIKAVETVDACLARSLRSADRAGATVLITADHGNCELMVDPDTGSPHTAHTTNPVPLVLLGDEGTRGLRQGGALCDIGPTVLSLLGLEPPCEMTGRDLREE
ncbi:MAG: 2,3-bisphosphoglycerate-independent phosphoglycerate mutase [Gemmatimonadetes bacterium]|nr:2,3-bisphosphoglycerate-independent phosphoglycerate mutase [Gemmatimonadota bacterium]